jgi:hypothetical protein
VNKNESDQMVEALKSRGVEVEYMVKDNEGHGFHNEENRFDFYNAMEKFLDQHIGSGYKARPPTRPRQRRRRRRRLDLKAEARSHGPFRSGRGVCFSTDHIGRHYFDVLRPRQRTHRSRMDDIATALKSECRRHRTKAGTASTNAWACWIPCRSGRRPNSHVVSVGNLVLHLCGNVGPVDQQHARW